ncbi:MAG: hypothetical protein A2Y45_01740 [Tenericutes bacterium GWC2_34_14]|nr:MAG: hypothetical protein A2Z84_07315 [Tenericutes bacterium GWA2_35_7]OHE28255.1 MAG: hypothetical protein A2Y45_01740 [Tenericutes bacterium GWC2_34_14]OHE33119.1 MAG: hypothetical protein A2012_00340 [Tenericutes bacterium GWE2_34_108]OHE36239.1 MAG: hypothetical protein A2Y46_07330 [Tenericutes bacterium GWF1_35_14]OHE38719.1 MAG: hypothetical protein A2Y44_04900 [Tenericutes bacterium GWF2_35_184]OHE43037.1 MAG: hypothetical protein A3K26_00020 [Tenericutes bacterium RIFOXYA12_FULL_35_
MKKIIVIGAGPGGLAASLLLQARGFDVTLIEKDEHVGGRSKRVSLGEFHFDLGPTFLMYIDVLKQVFERSGYDLEKEINLIKLDPLYKLIFKDHTLELSADLKKNIAMYESMKPGLGQAYQSWLNDQTYKMTKIKSILEKPFPNVFHLFRPDVLKAAPVSHPFKSVYSLLKTYDRDDHFIHSLSFQAKYLGMASYQAPSIFTILPYLEHVTGLYHVEGGLNQINEVMAKLFKEKGGNLLTNTQVTKVLVEKHRVQCVELENGEKILSDVVVMNADFAYAMTQLFNQKDLRKYKKEKTEKKKYSISTWMMYLGINRKLDLPHHEIIFSDDYNQYLKDLMNGKLTKDLSIYVHNPSVIDETLAPQGKSSIYILLPVPNLKHGYDWDEESPNLKEFVYNRIKEKHGFDIKSMIEVEKIYTPSDWMKNEHVYQGAVFNLSHGLDQMLFLRPHNQFEDVKGIYLVGGGTHPGSGLPTIYQSALIADDLISKLT